jgi:tellurite resistance protein
MFASWPELLYAGALVAVARADGELSPRELTFIQARVKARLGLVLDDETLFFCDDGLEAISSALARRADPAEGPGRVLLDDAVEVATVDDPVNDLERAAILDLAAALGLTPPDALAVWRN